MAKFDARTNLFVNAYTQKTVDGIDYLVVEGVPVRANQVMNTYYIPPEELEFADMWNGTPITIRHPKKNNGSALVPSPDVNVIGRFFNSTWDQDGNRVTGEYWINIADAMRCVEGQYILNQIYSNKVLETSTGYWASEEFSAGDLDGHKYETIQHNIHPNHIAILVDEIGACSVENGCGVNRNSLMHAVYQNYLVVNGGPGSGNYGHTGRPDMVGGSGPSSTKPKASGKSKILKKDQNAYYIAKGTEADRIKTQGFKTRVTVMSSAKAQALFDRMKSGEGDPTIFRIHLKKGTEYESISASTITLKSISADLISKVNSIAKTEPFTNAVDCGCTNPKEFQQLAINAESLIQKVDRLRKAFYDEFTGESPTMMYITDYYPDYLIVEGAGSQLWKCTYTESNGEYKFQNLDDWTKMQTNPEKYVEANAQQDMPASCYLVVEDDGTRHLQVKDANGKPNHRLMGAAWAALHGGYRGQKYAGPNKSEALAKLKALYAKEKLPLPSANTQKKGVSITKVISTQPTANVRTNSSKEKTAMKKFSLSSIVDALRQKGVTLNEDQLSGADEELELDLEEVEEEAEETPVVTPQAPALNAKQAKVLEQLSGVDFSALINLAKTAPALLQMTQNAQAEMETRKATLIGQLVANSANKFSKEELEGMTLPVLTKLDASLSTDYSGITGGGIYLNTGDDDDEVLALPNSSAFVEGGK